MMPLPPQQPKPSPAYLASLRQRMAAAPSTQEMARGLDIPPIHEYSIFEYAYLQEGKVLEICGSLTAHSERLQRQQQAHPLDVANKVDLQRGGGEFTP